MTSNTGFNEIWNKDPLILDGAVGTELERHGVPTPPPLWSAAALTSHPTRVQATHHAYAASGAQIIVANTFRVNAFALGATGRTAEGPELARAAVALARRGAEAAERTQNVLIAASIGPARDCYRPADVPDSATLEREHATTLAWLADTNVDLLWIETIGTVREAVVLAKAARASERPFVMSFILNEAGDLLGGEPLRDAVACCEPYVPLAFGLNCMPPAGLTRHVAQLRSLTARRIAAYAHIGNATPLPGWSFSAARVTPAELAADARRWQAAGASILGGCCGTTAEHIQALRAELVE
jgi:S-methylmethionine-dependent homocysteine/selenocysteine methylase